METINEIKKIIKEQKELGNIVIANIDGLTTCKLSDFVKQNASGILYDLNRLEEVTYTFADMDDLRWINDIAVAYVIRELKNNKTE